MLRAFVLADESCLCSIAHVFFKVIVSLLYKQHLSFRAYKTDLFIEDFDIHSLSVTNVKECTKQDIICINMTLKNNKIATILFYE